MREIIGRMTISDLVQNRDKFAQETQRAATTDMKNMGLEIVNLTIQNFSDNDGVLDTLAVKNISEKKRDADIAKAEAERDTVIRQATAQQEGFRAKAESDANMAEQEKLLELKRASYRAEQDKAKAMADIAYNLQQEVSRKDLETERAAAELVRLEKQTQLQAQQVQVERERLSVEIRERAEADFFKAQKEAEAALVLARNEAEAIFESVKEAVGIDIPKMLKDVTTGGLIGKAASEATEK